MSVAIHAVTTWLPPDVETCADAVRSGRLDEGEVDGVGVVELPISTMSPPGMAALAARSALGASGQRADAVSILIHAWVHHQGHDFWSPAHFVARSIGADNAVPFGVNQMCNGGAMALATARCWLQSGAAKGPVVVTTGDRFSPPGFDRWRSDDHVGYGDGATAAVLGDPDEADSDFLLLGLALEAAPEMETMYRGDDPFSVAARELRPTIDARQTKRHFARAGGMERFKAVAPAKVRSVIRRALREAGVRGDDERIRCVALPRLGPRILDLMYLPAVADTVPKAEPLMLGARTGHLGAGDFLANLADVRSRGLLQPGELGLVVGGGGGFTWTCAVVECHTVDCHAVDCHAVDCHTEGG